MAGEEVFTDTENRMQKAVDAVRKELSSIRAGRATPALVERIMVEYYGTSTPMQQLANIHATDARTLTIQPWDRTTLGEIEKAIQKSDLGINPTNDGQVIRLAVPQLTEERRKDLVKQTQKKLEEGHIAVRNLRRDAQDKMRDQEKKKEISEDDLKRNTERLQKMTDKYIEEINKLGKAKEAEMMEV